LSAIPSNYRINTLNSIDQNKMEWFCQRYVEEYYSEYGFGHFLLAAYASVPALLTPDLLYKIWQNFHGYKWGGVNVSIHRVAVSDILLSPLCREVGFELYEMDVDIKLSFLEWLKDVELKETLWKKRGIHRLEEIARFVQQYHEIPNIGAVRWGKSYTESQQLEALSYFDPVQLVNILFEKLREQSGSQQETGLLRTMDMFLTTEKRLDRVSKDSQVLKYFRDNVPSLDAFKDLIQKNSKAFLEKIAADTTLSQFLSDENNGGIEIRVPVATASKLTEIKVSATNSHTHSTTDHPVKQKIVAGIAGVSEPQIAGAASLLYVTDNTRRFLSFLGDYCQTTEKELQMAVPPLYGTAKRSDLEQILRSFEQADNGDACVLFYSGAGMINHEKELVDIVFNDDTADHLFADTPLDLKKRLVALVAAKNIHVLIILDMHFGIPVNRIQEPVVYPETMKGSIVIFQNCEDRDLIHILPEREATGNNHFVSSLLNLLSEGGSRLNYSELFTRLKLRMSRIEQLRPARYTIPLNSKERTFLSGAFKKGSQYDISFDKKLGWTVNAGARHGIRPSLSFMETIFLLENKTRAIVKEVFASYSTLNELEADRSLTYKASLIQNAFPKIKIAFDPDINQHLKERFQKSVKRYDIYYIELVEDSSAATFLISSLDDKFMLIRPGQLHEQRHERQPVFDYQTSSYEFIKQIEYIAQWQAVLEFDNPETRLPKDNIWFSFEKIEGQSLKEDKLNTIFTEVIPDTEPVVLNYEKKDGVWKQPAFRCRVKNVKRSFQVSIVYLGSTYEILSLGHLEINDAENNTYITLSFNGQQYETLPVYIEKDYVERGITEVTEYIKFFISEKPMNVKVLEQEALKFGEVQLMRNIESGRDIPPFDTTGTDWITVTIPIKIRWERNDQQSSETIH
jgi:hypothetical protein